MDWNGSGDSAPDRRKFLKVVGAASTVGLAGCGGGDDGGDGGDGSDGDDGSDGGGSDGSEGSDGGDGSDGDDMDDGGDGDMSVEWTIGTSGPETATHASGVAMSEVISDKSDSISMSAQTTGGTAANPRLIAQEDIDVAQSTDWAVARSNSGGDPYGEPVDKTMTQVLPFMTLEYYLVRRTDDALSDIQTVSDIPQDGSVSMAFGQRGGTNFFAGLDGFRLSGIEDVQDKYDLQSMSWGDQGSQFADGRLDMMLVYGVSREVLTGWAQEAGAQTDVAVVEWEFTAEDMANADLPYTYIETPADLWDGQDIRLESVPAVGVGYQTVFPAEVPQELGYEFVSTVMSDIDAVREASSVLQRAGPDFARDFLLPSPNAPVHPGAEQYYKEQDLWKEGLTTLEEYEG